MVSAIAGSSFLLRMDDYTGKAKVYWWTTAAVGLLALAFAVDGLAHQPPEAVLRIVLGALFAAITGLYPVRIPGATTAGSVAEIFVFLLLIEYGADAAVVAASAEAAVISWRTSTRLTSRLGSPALAALAMWACGNAFVVLQTALSRHDVPAIVSPFGLLLVVAVTYFAAGTLLVASLIALKRGQSVHPLVILRDHAWLGLAYAASGAMAVLLHLAFGRSQISVLLAAAPMIVAFLVTLHLFYRHAEAEARMQAERVAAAEEAATESARLLAELRESEDRFQSAFTHAAVGMMLVSTGGRILQANGALARMLGRAEADLAGTEIANVFHPEDRAALQAELVDILLGNESTFSMELRCRHKQGIDVCVLLNGSFFTANAPLARCLILQLQDITARRRAESRLQHIAYHDDLTNLPNRNHFVERLTRAIAAAQRHPQRRFAMLMLDFDRFKLVNDSLGHSAGDRLLMELATRIQAHLKPTELIARLGGDEFAILVEDEHADVEAVRLAERLREVLAAPVYVKGVAISTSASIGITTSTFGYETPEQVMRDADTAMYRAKSLATGQHVLFDSALHAEAAGRLWMENALRRAIAHDELYVVYQPIFDLAEQRLMGFEALARWTHPERGPISPKDFIPIAEETGLILPLGRWVLETACSDLGRWQTAYPASRKLSMHVNVSGMQLLQPDFEGIVRDAVLAADLDPAQLSIELTESVLVENLAVALPHLVALREFGATISIDDFGTGYSSFSLLSRLPVNAIKIDQSFVASLGRDQNGQAIVAGIIALGRTLDKTMIAEGIETDEQMERLVALGCARGQGFLLGRPLEAEQAGGLVLKSCYSMESPFLLR